MKSGAGLQKTGNSSAVQVLLGAILSWRTLFAISVIEVDTLSISGQLEP
jgi:hypothetical protein